MFATQDGGEQTRVRRAGGVEATVAPAASPYRGGGTTHLGSLIHTIGDDGSHLPLRAYLMELNRFKANVSNRRERQFHPFSSSGIGTLTVGVAPAS
jgi:hypothetical protein